MDGCYEDVVVGPIWSLPVRRVCESNRGSVRLGLVLIGVSMDMQLQKMLFLFCWGLLAVACTRGAEPGPVVPDAATRTAVICVGSECSEPARNSDIGLALCPEGEILVASNAVSSSSLVVCDCRCTSHDNAGWIVWSDGTSAPQSVVQIYAGKLVSRDTFSATASPMIGDRLANVPMCVPVDREQLDQSDFTTLIKRPTNLEEFPYCFDPLYISIQGSGVRLKLGDRWIEADDGEFFRGEVPDGDLDDLNRLLSD